MLSKTEPLRRWLYGALVALAAVLVGKGIITTADAGYYLTLAASVLVIGGATEIARTQVSPTPQDPADDQPILPPAN